MKTLAAIITLSLSVTVHAHEKIIKKFNGSIETVSSMSKIIRKGTSEGATVVTFPGGRWKWHNLTQLSLPSKAKPAKKEYSEVNDQLEASIKRWIKVNDIKAIQIRVNPRLPADVFFRVEKCVSLLNMPYSVTSMKAPMKDAVWLMETDGKVISIKPSANAVPVPSIEVPDPTTGGFE